MEEDFSIVIELNENGGFTALSPDFPGVIGIGETVQEAQGDLREAVAEIQDKRRDEVGGESGVWSATIEERESVESSSSGLPDEGPHFARAVVRGLAATLVAATLLAAIAERNQTVNMFVFYAIGVWVGLNVRSAGKGRSVRYRILGAALVMLCCLLGMAWATVLNLVHEERSDRWLLAFLASLNPKVLRAVIQDVTGTAAGRWIAVAMILGYLLSARSSKSEPFGNPNPME